MDHYNSLFPKLAGAIAARGAPFRAYFFPMLDVNSGPDAQDTLHYNVAQLTVTFCASELRLRGETFVTQPHRDSEGNVLCWNGEVSL